MRTRSLRNQANLAAAPRGGGGQRDGGGQRGGGGPGGGGGSRGGGASRGRGEPRGGAVLRRFRPTRARGYRRAGAGVLPPDVSSITNWSFLDLDSVPSVASAAEDVDTGEAASNTTDRDAEMEALKTLVENQKELLEKQGEYIEDLRDQQEKFSEQVAERIEDTETRVGSRICNTESSLNSKLLGPSTSDFKYKSSNENLARLNKIRALALKAQAELGDNFGAGFEQLSGAKALNLVLEEIEDQE